MFESVQHQSSLLAPYSVIKRERWQHSKLWISVIREEGRRMFEKMGLPGQRREEWKYTDVSAISRYSFSPPAPLKEPGPGLPEPLMSSIVSPLRLVFVNGFYSSLLSRLDAANLPEGVEIGSLGAAINRNHPLLQTNLAAYADAEENSFVALNSAFIEDGAWVYIPEGVRFEQPVHLVYIGTKKGSGDRQPAVHYPRNLIVADRDAAVTIIEEYAGENGSVYLTDAVTEIVVNKGAEVDHYKLQRESEQAFHLAAVQVIQGKGSHFRSHSVSFGGQLTRNNIHSQISGSGSSCTFNGLFMVHDKQHVDNHTLIDHRAPDCRSSEVYHGILDDRARGVFNGKIYVHRDAQKTDSRQISRSLMLSNDAIVDAKPQLEIFADDVKCTHGATVGQLDANSLYYLRSRGISADEARRMMVLGFARQITSQFKPESFRKAVETLLAERLENGNR
jgi:Fe-S cluster assembly protein SufD